MQAGESIQKHALPEATLEELGVLAVYLFGSHAEGRVGPNSDIDIAVLFHDHRVVYRDTRELYNRLYTIFADCFDMSGFKDMDIVFLQKAPLELTFNVIKNGRVLYVADDRERLAFEDRISLKYKDFRPRLRRMDREILSSI